ncbi:MAG: hypothetical protein AB4911_06795 [Oscillochloridaceae bacterium umkhey_bin13]
MTPIDRVQQTYLEQRRDMLIASQAEVVYKAVAARTYLNNLPKRNLCPKELARLERLAQEAETHSRNLSVAITALGAELAADLS